MDPSNGIPPVLESITSFHFPVELSTSLQSRYNINKTFEDITHGTIVGSGCLTFSHRVVNWISYPNYLCLYEVSIERARSDSFIIMRLPGNDATAMVVDFLVGPVKANDDKETFSCFVCLSDCCCLEIGFIAAENESIFSSAAMLSKGLEISLESFIIASPKFPHVRISFAAVTSLNEEKRIVLAAEENGTLIVLNLGEEMKFRSISCPSLKNLWSNLFSPKSSETNKIVAVSCVNISIDTDHHALGVALDSSGKLSVLDLLNSCEIGQFNILREANLGGTSDALPISGNQSIIILMPSSSHILTAHVEGKIKLVWLPAIGELMIGMALFAHDPFSFEWAWQVYVCNVKVHGPSQALPSQAAVTRVLPISYPSYFRQLLDVSFQSTNGAQHNCKLYTLWKEDDSVVRSDVLVSPTAFTILSTTFEIRSQFKATLSTFVAATVGAPDFKLELHSYDILQRSSHNDKNLMDILLDFVVRQMLAPEKEIEVTCAVILLDISAEVSTASSNLMKYFIRKPVVSSIDRFPVLRLLYPLTPSILGDITRIIKKTLPTWIKSKSDSIESPDTIKSCYSEFLKKYGERLVTVELGLTANLSLSSEGLLVTSPNNWCYVIQLYTHETSLPSNTEKIIPATPISHQLSPPILSRSSNFRTSFPIHISLSENVQTKNLFADVQRVIEDLKAYKFDEIAFKLMFTLTQSFQTSALLDPRLSHLIDQHFQSWMYSLISNDSSTATIEKCDKVLRKHCLDNFDAVIESIESLFCIQFSLSTATTSSAMIYPQLTSFLQIAVENITSSRLLLELINTSVANKNSGAFVSLRNSIHRLNTIYLHVQFILWLRKNRLAYINTQILQSQTHELNDAIFYKMFPEFKTFSSNSIAPINSLNTVVAYDKSLLNCFLEYYLQVNTSSNCIDLNSQLFINTTSAFCIEYQQHGFLSRFLGIVSYSCQHAHSHHSYYLLDRINLLLGLISFKDGLLHASRSVDYQVYREKLMSIGEKLLSIRAPRRSTFVDSDHRGVPILHLESSLDCMKELFKVSFLSGLFTSEQFREINSSDLYQLHNAVRLAQFLQIFQACESSLPKNLGSELCLRATYELIFYINHLDKSHLLPRYTLELKRVERKCWHSAFQYSLKMGSFDETLQCILQLRLGKKSHINFHSAVNPREHNNRTDTFILKNCVQSMVSEACLTGKLNWLCNTATKNVDIVLRQQIIESLTILAFTTNVRRVNTLGGDINFYECLTVYLMSIQQYKEAATVLWKYSERLRIENMSLKRSSITALWGLSLSSLILSLFPKHHYLSIERIVNNEKVTDAITVNQVNLRAELLFCDILLSEVPECQAEALNSEILDEYTILKKLIVNGFYSHVLSISELMTAFYGDSISSQDLHFFKFSVLNSIERQSCTRASIREEENLTLFDLGIASNFNTNITPLCMCTTIKSDLLSRFDPNWSFHSI